MIWAGYLIERKDLKKLKAGTETETNYVCKYLGAIFILRKGKGVGGIAKYLLFLTGVGGWFWIILT